MAVTQKLTKLIKKFEISTKNNFTENLRHQNKLYKSTEQLTFKSSNKTKTLPS